MRTMAQRQKEMALKYCKFLICRSTMWMLGLSMTLDLGVVSKQPMKQTWYSLLSSTAWFCMRGERPMSPQTNTPTLFMQVLQCSSRHSSAAFKSLDLLKLPIFFEVELEQFEFLGVELVDGGDEVQVVLEVIVVVVVLDPEVHHFLEDVLEALVVELLPVEGLFLLVDLVLEDGVLLQVQSFSLFLHVLLLVYLNTHRGTVFSCSVFSFMREVIMYYFYSMIFFSLMYSFDGFNRNSWSSPEMSSGQFPPSAMMNVKLFQLWIYRIFYFMQLMKSLKSSSSCFGSCFTVVTDISSSLKIFSMACRRMLNSYFSWILMETRSIASPSSQIQKWSSSLQAMMRSPKQLTTLGFYSTFASSCFRDLSSRSNSQSLPRISSEGMMGFQWWLEEGLDSWCSQGSVLTALLSVGTRSVMVSMLNFIFACCSIISSSPFMESLISLPSLPSLFLQFMISTSCSSFAEHYDSLRSQSMTKRFLFYLYSCSYDYSLPRFYFSFSTLPLRPSIYLFFYQSYFLRYYRYAVYFSQAFQSFFTFITLFYSYFLRQLWRDSSCSWLFLVSYSIFSFAYLFSSLKNRSSLAISSSLLLRSLPSFLSPATSAFNLQLFSATSAHFFCLSASSPLMRSLSISICSMRSWLTLPGVLFLEISVSMMLLMLIFSSSSLFSALNLLFSLSSWSICAFLRFRDSDASSSYFSYLLLSLLYLMVFSCYFRSSYLQLPFTSLSFSSQACVFSSSNFPPDSFSPSSFSVRNFTFPSSYFIFDWYYPNSQSRYLNFSYCLRISFVFSEMASQSYRIFYLFLSNYQCCILSRSLIFDCFAFISFRRAYSLLLYFSSRPRFYSSLRSWLRLWSRLPFSLTRSFFSISPSRSLALLTVGFGFSIWESLCSSSSAFIFAFLCSAWQQSSSLLEFSSFFLSVLSYNFLSSSTWSLSWLAVKQYLVVLMCSASELNHVLMVFFSFLNSFLRSTSLTLYSCSCLCSMISLLLLFSTSLLQAYSSSPIWIASCFALISTSYFRRPAYSISFRSALLAFPISMLFSLYFLSSSERSLFLLTSFYTSVLNSLSSYSILASSYPYYSLLRITDRLYLLVNDLLRLRFSFSCQERIFWMALLLLSSNSDFFRMVASRVAAFSARAAFLAYSLQFSQRSSSPLFFSAARSSSRRSSLRVCLAREVLSSPMMNSDCLILRLPSIAASRDSLIRWTRSPTWAVSTSTAARAYSTAEHFCESVEKACCWSLLMVAISAARGCWRLCGLSGEYLREAATVCLWVGYQFRISTIICFL